MINRETHRELCEKHKELEEDLRQKCEEIEYWKQQSYTLELRNKQLKAELKLWMGTGV
tara:strand:- start:44 stop:217 length:174 start_codon:yes stop_codon:yes gene_type:complete